jgi:hypothetical protein
VLYAFKGEPTDGSMPEAGVIIGAGGVLYGVTVKGESSSTVGLNRGIIFQLTPSAAGSEWTETILHSFSGPDGAYPASALTLGPGGVLYGITGNGGTSHNGTIFQLIP